MQGGLTQQQLDSEAVINHLNAVIKLYRNASAELQTGGAPTDVIYQDNEQSLTAEVVRLAFQAARAEAAAIRATEKAGASSTSSAQSSAQTEARNKARIAEVQAKLDNIDKQIASAPKNKRDALLAQKQALEGELSLDNAVQEVIQKRAAFMESGNDAAAEGLEGRINQLAHSVPGVFAATNDEKSGTLPKPTTQSDANKQTPSGLVSQALALYGAITSVHQIDQLNKQTASVRQSKRSAAAFARCTRCGHQERARSYRSSHIGPNSSRVAATISGADRSVQTVVGRGAAAEPGNRGARSIQRHSCGMANVDSSRVEIRGARIVCACGHDPSGVGHRFGFVGGVWRRLTYKYIHDTRRRRQFLLMRRFVMGFLIGVVLILGFVSEFSSLATFAGFVTAGIAVGLQTVLLSVAAYFFVVGRYGIHVGDRVSVSGVTGDVIDISLVRLYLMELAGTGIDLFPTGRVVVFSNSVLFQATTPLFKQIPGTEYA